MQWFSIIPRAWLWIIAGLIVMAASLWLFFGNLRLSIQFTGGMEVVVEKQQIDEEKIVTALTTVLTEKGYSDFAVGVGQKDAFPSILIQMAVSNEGQIAEVTQLINQTLLDTQTVSSADEILEFSIIGPSVGDYIKKTAKLALIWGMILMFVYILFAFSGMRGVVSPVLLSTITVVTMIFDIAISAGAYGILMMFNEAVQVDTIFIIALLTVMGYSINDTIVIFDRLRENFIEKRNALEKGQITREEIFESSLRQTMRRSLATGTATLGVIVVMRFFGTGFLRMFAFTLGVGIIGGTYSSIFMAAPLAYLFSRGTKIGTAHAVKDHGSIASAVQSIQAGTHGSKKKKRK